MRTHIVLVLALLSAPLAFSQSGTYRLMMQSPYSMAAVTGVPYSAEQTSELTQTLADGTHISHPTATIKVFRDSAGRTRTERYSAPAKAPSFVEIYDVVGGYRYILDPANKIAHRSAILPRPQGQIVTGGITGSPVGTARAPQGRGRASTS